MNTKDTLKYVTDDLAKGGMGTSVIVSAIKIKLNIYAYTYIYKTDDFIVRFLNVITYFLSCKFNFKSISKIWL